MTSDAESLRSWWNRCRIDPCIRRYAHSSPSQRIIDSLHIDHLIDHPTARILDIGIGDGAMCRTLHRQGLNVDALDISEMALLRVKRYVQNTWIAHDLGKIPERVYDLAMSHLTAQHMCDADLIAQFCAVIRSLKPKGVLAVQFALLFQDSDTQQEDLFTQKTGGVCRSERRIAEIIEAVGGRCTYTGPIQTFTEQRARWIAVHIQRQS